ncbi:hypothetical protein TWF281_007170 [Arthrobotrys megalospora]
MSVSLFTLPRELVDEILSYVSKRDFKRFSRCSRACRDFIIPLVFTRVEWRTASRAAAFCDGGIVEHLRPVVRLHDLSGVRGSDYYAALPEKNKEYLGPKIRLEDNIELPPVPPGLTELIVAAGPFPITPHRKIESHLTFLHRPTTKTLTRLLIRSDSVFVQGDYDDVKREKNFRWEGVKQVQLEVGYADLIVLSEIKDRFPDLEELVVLKHGAWRGGTRWDKVMSREDALCNAFQGMKKLRRVRLPWPIGAIGGGLEHHASTVMLKNVVNSWVKGGAERLEKVVFVRDDPSLRLYEAASRSFDAIVGFNIVRDRFSREPEWEVEVERGDTHEMYIRGVAQRPMEELFQVSPRTKRAPIESRPSTLA